MAGAALAATPDVIASETKLQLLAGPAFHDDTYVAGVAISMPPGSHTYWKMPGDAGVPPVFSFAGSRNLRSATVAFETPRRIAEAGIEAYGYLDKVVFPVEATPTDPTKPVELHVDVTYAVCNTICIPAHGAASVTLDPKAGAGDHANLVEAAVAAVPAPASPAERADLSIMPVPGAPKPTWTLAWHGTGALDDIFADAPEGYFFATRKTGPATWRLVADEVAKAQMPVAVALTLARAEHSLVVTEKLDTQSATR